MQELATLLADVMAFHRAPETAAEDDLRLYWDVRLVRGKDEPWAHVTGSSTLPGATDPERLAMLTTLLTDEIDRKIGMPLASRAQKCAQARQDTLMESDVNFLNDSEPGPVVEAPVTPADGARIAEGVVKEL